jgi:3-phenylpropionate/trans-cinnamate dioxygenase ferredoxin subunit
MSLWIDVAAADDFAPGSRRVVDADGVRVVVFNLDGRYYAIRDCCTHEDAELSDGALDGEEIVCPWHGARFSIVTGAVTAPPAYENLQTYAVRVADGRVEVDAGSA